MGQLIPNVGKNRVFKDESLTGTFNPKPGDDVYVPSHEEHGCLMYDTGEPGDEQRFHVELPSGQLVYTGEVTDGPSGVGN